MSIDVPDSVPMGEDEPKPVAAAKAERVAVRSKSRIGTMIGIGLLAIVPLGLGAIFIKWFSEPDTANPAVSAGPTPEISAAEAQYRARLGGVPVVGTSIQAMPDLTAEMRPIQATVGRFHIHRDGAPDPKGGRRALVVSLPAQWTDAPPGIIHGPHYGTIGRELVNQAFLIAARDELGLATRETTLGDALPERFTDLFVEIVAPYETGAPLVVTVRREGPRGEVAVTKEFPWWTDGARDYSRFAAKAEALSRGPFVETLRAAGLDGKPNRLAPEAKPAPAVGPLLETMTFTTQFAAIRGLHDEIRSNGESPERLAALSRGYAQLANLTEYQWSPADKFYKARALLYAERLATRSPKSAAALRARGFVRALVGLHRLALDDLDAAAKLSPAVAASPLTSVVDAYCRFDTNGLDKVKEGPHVALAQWLRFLTAENYFDSHTRTLKIARESLDANPECFRLLDAMCQAGSLGTLHQVTEAAPRYLASTLPPRLLAIDGLPATVKATLGPQPDDLAITEALALAGAPERDPNELSWSTLGRSIEEARFVMVWRRADFMRNKWNVPVGEFLEAARPLVAKHPFARYIDSFGGAINTARGQSRSQFNHADLELNEMPFFRSLRESDFEASAMLTILSQRHADEVFRDLEIGARTFDDSKQRVSAISLPERLQAASPFSPFAAALLVKSYWELAEPHAAEWERLFAQHPQVFASLADRYRDLNRPDDQKRCLVKFLEIVPDAFWAHDRLAEIELKAGRIDRWKAILDDYLAKTEPDGLEHAQIQVKIARSLMSRGEWAKAQPYAEEAAQTWAGWAMECAAECYEHMEDWGQAEVWYQREAERYSVSWFQWFHFCKRTGRGNVNAAKALAADYLKAAGNRLTDNEEALAVFFYDLGHEPAAGVRFLRPLFPRPQHILEGMFLAMFADQAGDASLRDDTWKRIPKDDPEVSSLAAMFLAATSEKKELDLKRLDALIGSAHTMRQADLCYFAGRFLERHGRIEDALTYWRRCVALPDAKDLVRLAAVNAIRDHEPKKATPEAKEKPIT